MIKPRPLQPAVEGGFTLDDFTVDEGAGTATCPAGVTRPITARRTVIFGAACRTCPLRARCTAAKKGGPCACIPMTRCCGPPRPLGRPARPAGGLQEIPPQCGARDLPGRQPRRRRLKLRYLGTAKNNAWLKNRTAALNLRNLIRRGLDHRDGSWVLA